MHLSNRQAPAPSIQPFASSTWLGQSLRVYVDVHKGIKNRGCKKSNKKRINTPQKKTKNKTCRCTCAIHSNWPIYQLTCEVWVTESKFFLELRGIRQCFSSLSSAAVLTTATLCWFANCSTTLHCQAQCCSDAHHRNTTHQIYLPCLPNCWKWISQ